MIVMKVIEKWFAEKRTMMEIGSWILVHAEGLVAVGLEDESPREPISHHRYL